MDIEEKVDLYIKRVLFQFPKIELSKYPLLFSESFLLFEKLKNDISSGVFSSDMIKRSFDKFPYLSFRFIPEEFKYNIDRITGLNRRFNRGLSIGCGPLVYENFLIENGVVKCFDAVDISREQLSTGMKLWNNPIKINPICENFDHYSTGQKYDFICFVSSIHWFENPINTMKRSFELAAENAIVYITYYDNFFNRPTCISETVKLYEHSLEQYEFIHHRTGTVDYMNSAIIFI